MKNHKSLFVLIGLGTFCLFCGIGFSYVENHFSPGTTLLSLVGFFSFLVSYLALKKVPFKSAGTVQWKRLMGKVLLILGTFLMLVAINSLAYKFNRRWDLTKFHQHTLTDTTQSLIKNLKQNVKITALYVGLPPMYLEDLFKEYERVSHGEILTEVIDPIVQIGYAAQFGNVISGKEKKAIVQSGQERKDIDFTERPLSEDQLNHAILQVIRKARHIYFLTGHGEYDIFDDGKTGLSTFAKLLIANNVIPQQLMLGTSDSIPSDCDVLVIAGAKNPLTQEEEKIIQEYLKEGRDALFLIENTMVTTPDVPLREDQLNKNPSLNNILENWGIKVANDIVVDLGSHASGDVGSPATRYYMGLRSVVSGLDYTFYIRPRSISLLSDRRKTLRLVPLVLTASQEQSWGETNRTLQVKFDEGLDRPGPVPIAFMIWEPKKENETSDTRIVVFTDSDFLTNNYINEYSNAQMGLNVIQWLSELDDQTIMNQREMGLKRLDLTSKQKRVVVVILFIMPLFIALCGFITWIKRHVS